MPSQITCVTMLPGGNRPNGTDHPETSGTSFTFLGFTHIWGKSRAVVPNLRPERLHEAIRRVGGVRRDGERFNIARQQCAEDILNEAKSYCIMVSGVQMNVTAYEKMARNLSGRGKTRVMWTVF